MIKGSKITEEHRNKLREAKIGNIPWNKGKTGIYSEETTKKLSHAAKERMQDKKYKEFVLGKLRENSVSPEANKKRSITLKKYYSSGSANSLITKNKISVSRKGRKMSIDSINKIKKQLGKYHFGSTLINIPERQYSNSHKYISNIAGKADDIHICSMCNSDKEKRYEWSNKSHNYSLNIDDWWVLCKKCHIKYDISIKKMKLQEMK